MKRHKLRQSQQNWLSTEHAQRYLALEKTHQDRVLRQVSGPRVLVFDGVISTHQVGSLDFPQLIVISEGHNNGENLTQNSGSQLATYVNADPAFLPFEPDSFSTIVFPHVLESNALPHQVLREAHRVLRSDGHLVLNGFNPFSFIGLQRYLSPRAVYSGNYYSVGRVKDWLQLLGFEVVGSAMYQYAPLLRNKRLTKVFNFLNSAGDRWLPMSGGGYIINAKKRDVNPNLVGRVRSSKNRRKRQKLVAASSTPKSKLLR